MNAISHSCTKLVDPGVIVEHKELNYLIIQACNYYELADKEKWTSPLLVALRGSQELPIATGKMIPRAKEGEVSNYDAIETMINFGTRKINNLEGAWLTAVYETTMPGNLDLQSTIQMLRNDATFKISRL